MSTAEDPILPTAPTELTPDTQLPLAPVRGPAPLPEWTLGDVLRLAGVALLAMLAAGFAAGLVVAAIYGRVPSAEAARDPKLIIPAQLGAYLLIVSYMVVLVRSRRARFWEGVRWNWPQLAWAKYVALGTALALVVQAASALLPIPKQLPIEQYFRDRTAAWIMAIFGVSMAPLVEELFFRGFLYPALARKLGVAAGVALTALPFALIHASQLASAWAPLLLLFIVGVALTVVRARSASVAASFLVHAAYNGTLFVMLYIGTDGFRNLDKLR